MSFPRTCQITRAKLTFSRARISGNVALALLRPLKSRKTVCTLSFLVVILLVVLQGRRKKTYESPPSPPPIPPPPPPFVFGLISDIQYADVSDGVNLDSGKPRHHRDSLRKLEVAVEEWRRAGVEMVVDLGDILDDKSRRQNRRTQDLDAVERKLANLTVPYYHLLGNHDLSNLDFDEWGRLTRYKFRQSLPAPEFRLSFSPYPLWRFIMLNSYAVSVLGRANDSRATQDAWRWLRRRNRNKNPNSFSGLGPGSTNRRWTAYNAALGGEQLRWAAAELKKAEERRERVVVFSHIPLHPEVSKFIAWDYEDALNLMERHRDAVAVIISGHDHDGAQFYDAGRKLDFLTLKGVIETDVGKPAHYVCRLNSSVITVYAAVEGSSKTF